MMADSSSRAIRAVLEYDVDTQSQSRTLKSLGEVSKATDELGNSKAFNRLTVSAEEYQAILQKTGGDEQAMLRELNKLEQSRALEGLSDEADQVSASTQQAVANVKKLSDELDNLPTPNVASTVSAAEGGLDLQNVGRNIRYLPSAQIGGTSTDQIGRVVESLGAVGLSLGTVLAVAAPLAIVGGTLALAMEGQREAEEKLAEATQATIDKIEQEAQVREQVAGVIATGSAGTARAQLAEAESQKDILSTGKLSDEIQALNDYIDKNIRPVAANEAKSDLRAAGISPGDDVYASELARRTNEQIISLLPDDPNVQKLQKDISDTNVQLSKFDDQISQIKDKGLPGAELLQSLNQPLDDQQKLRQLEAESSSELVKKRNADADDLVAINKRITDTETEITKARAAGDNVTADVLTTQNVKNRTDAEELVRELNLIAVSQSLVAAREKEISAMEIQEQKSKEAQDFFTSYPVNVKKANDDIVKLDLDHAAAVAKIQGSIAAAEQQSAQDEAAKERDIQQKSNDDAAKLGEKFNVTRERAEEDLQRHLKSIYAEERDAIANRDTVSFAAAKNKERDEKEQAGVEERRRKQDYETQMRDLAKSQTAQIAASRVAAKKQLDQQVSALNAQLTNENAKYSAEITLRQQALDVMAQQYANFIARISGAGNAYRPPNALTGVDYTSDPTALTPEQYELWLKAHGVQQHATGDEARYTGLHWLEKGERVLTLGQTAQYNQRQHTYNSNFAMTFAPVLQGVTRREMKRNMGQAFDAFADRIGLT
jgi:hypothetical protein